MNTAIMPTGAIAALAMLALAGQAASAQDVPGWVKSNAAWWADGTISDGEFLSGISFLVSEGIIAVPPVAAAAEQSGTVPDWVKSAAAWWADGTISDGEFVSGVQHLMSLGLVSVPGGQAADQDHGKDAGRDAGQAAGTELAALEAQLAECSGIPQAYKRIDCEKPLKLQITVLDYKQGSQAFVLGPVTYYWKGLGSEGNGFEISPSGQPLLTIRMLAENNSPGKASLNCTSPSICSYDVWDGSKSFKYSGMDFTSGQIVLNPGDAREFNMLFGPNIGYGGTQLEYDPSKSYSFRINEEFGSASIPLPLG